MAQLKLQLVSFPMPSPKAATASYARTKQVDPLVVHKRPPFPLPSPLSSPLSGETLEQAVLLALHLRDQEAFERSMRQLKEMYGDYRGALPESANLGAQIGLWLLFLLTENRISDFHVELQQLGHLGLTAENRNVAFVVALEQAKMEGRYSKIWSSPAEARNTISASYVQFTEKLVETARQDIAEAIQVSYEALDLASAQRLLNLASKEATVSFVQSRGWHVREGQIVFRRDDASNALDAFALITQMLQYADELERII